MLYRADVELNHDDLEESRRQHASAFEDAPSLFDADDVEPLILVGAGGRAIRAALVEVDTDPIAPGDRFLEVDRLDPRRRILAATVMDKSPSGTGWRVREVDRFLQRVRHEEVEIRHVVEGQPDQ